MGRSEILSSLKNQPDAIKILEDAQAYFEKETEERRKFHELVHENMKAEFINGEVMMHSPVKFEHWDISIHLSASLQTFVKQHDLGKIGIEKVMVHLTRNDYEPDICFFSKEKAAQFRPGQLLFPAPDFIVEFISPITETVDRTLKMTDYAAHGVMEYWIIDPVKQSVEQYLLENSSFLLHVKLVQEGVVHASAIENYSIDLKEIF